MENIKVLGKDCAYKDGKLYFVSCDMNIIYSLNISNGHISLIDCVPNERAVESDICGGVAIMGNKLILLPYKTPYIWSYDLEVSEFERIVRKDYSYIGTGGMLQSVSWEGNLFIIGCSYPAIIKYSLQTKIINYIHEPFLDAMARNTMVKDVFFRSHVAVKDRFIYMASCLDNYVLKFNMATNEYLWIKVGSSLCKYSGITWDGKNFWLSPRNNSPIVQWNGNDKYIEINLPEGFEPNYNYFLGACFDGERIIIPNMLDQNSLSINVQDKKINYLNRQYALFKKVDDNMIVSQDVDGNIVIKQGDKMLTFSSELNTEEVLDFMKSKSIPILDNNKIYYEKSTLPLEVLISVIKR